MTIVTNVSDLSPLMREVLLRPAEPDLTAEWSSMNSTLYALLNRDLITLASFTDRTYRLTDAGKRCRHVLEQQAVPSGEITTVTPPPEIRSELAECLLEQQAPASGKPTEDHPLSEALDLIEFLTDSADDCRLNIIGDCLSHGWSFVAGEVCPVQRAKDFLAKHSRR